MPEAKLHKIVSALPGVLEANSIYFVRVGVGLNIYATNDTGTVVAFKHNDTVASSTERSGIATVDFGVNGSDIASVNVTGQAGILPWSIVHVGVALRFTDTHSPDEAMVEQMDVKNSAPSSDTGFTIYAITRNVKLYGKYDIYWSWR